MSREGGVERGAAVKEKVRRWSKGKGVRWSMRRSKYMKSDVKSEE